MLLFTVNFALYVLAVGVTCDAVVKNLAGDLPDGATIVVALVAIELIRSVLDRK